MTCCVGVWGGVSGGLLSVEVEWLCELSVLWCGCSVCVGEV